MVQRPTKTAFIITIVLVLVAATYIIKMNSPTGQYLGIKPCVDTDGGQEPFMYGYAHDLSGRTVFDECRDSQTVNEGYCLDGYYARQIPISCPLGKRCVSGVCER